MFPAAKLALLALLALCAASASGEDYSDAGADADSTIYAEHEVVPTGLASKNCRRRSRRSVGGLHHGLRHGLRHGLHGGLHKKSKKHHHHGGYVTRLPIYPHERARYYARNLYNPYIGRFPFGGYTFGSLYGNYPFDHFPYHH